MTDAELRDVLFELWRDGRSDNDRYNSVNGAQDKLQSLFHKAQNQLLQELLEQKCSYEINGWQGVAYIVAVPVSVIQQFIAKGEHE